VTGNQNINLWRGSFFICGFIALELASVPPAAVVVHSDWTVNTAIPKGSLVGITTGKTFRNLSGSAITGVTADLNIGSGDGAGLYGSMVLRDATGQTAMEICSTLLLRVPPSAGFAEASDGVGVLTPDCARRVSGRIPETTGQLVGRAFRRAAENGTRAARAPKGSCGRPLWRAVRGTASSLQFHRGTASTLQLPPINSLS
jgi:hypothetical protein